MPREWADPSRAQALQMAAEMGTRTRWIEVEPGVNVAVHEVGSPTGQRLLVFLPGWMSESRMWRFVQGPLGKEYRLLLVDPPGHGNSTKPADGADAAGCCRYCPASQARLILRAVRQELGRNPAERVTLVAHSIGGTFVLRMWMDPGIRAEYADVLDRVDGLVLFAPLDVAIEKDDVTARAIEQLSGWELSLGEAFNVLEQRMVDATRQGVVEADLALREEAERGIQIMHDRGAFRAAQAEIRRFRPSHGFCPDWDGIERVTAGYARVNVNCMIVWGARDESLGLAIGYKLKDELPCARLRIIDRAKHSVPVERPEIAVQLIRDFLSGTDDLRPQIARFPAAQPTAAGITSDAASFSAPRR